MSDQKELLQPKAQSAMDKLKLKVANETMNGEGNQPINETNYQETLDKKKYEVAEDLGLTEKINQVGWGNMTTKEVGQIGGRLGGKIGGNMVKELITMAESQMAPVSPEASLSKEAIKNYGNPSPTDKTQPPNPLAKS